MVARFGKKSSADLERLVGWLVGLLIDLVAVAFGIGGALFVAGDYYRLSAVEGPVVFAFFVAGDDGCNPHLSKGSELVSGLAMAVPFLGKPMSALCNSGHRPIQSPRRRGRAPTAAR